MFIIYFILELYNYYRYYKLKKFINRYKQHVYITNTEREQVVHNILVKDKDIPKLIEQFFYNKVQFKDINRNRLKLVLHKLLFGYDLDDRNQEYINNLITIIEQKTGVTFKENNKKQHYIHFYNHKYGITSWYYPFFIRLFLFILKKIFDIVLHLKGFTKKTYQDSYTIWTNNIESNKNVILFHCSFAGPLFYLKLINKMKNINLIIPEIHGVSWTLFYNIPINHNKMTNLLYNSLDRRKKYDIICHSFGWLSATNMLHKYRNIIDKTIFVETPVYINHSLVTFSEMYDLKECLKTFDAVTLFTIFFVFKNPYIQYYLYKDMQMTSILLGHEEYDNIYLILSEKDTRVPHDHYIHLSDKYNTKSFINKVHGSFIIDNDMQNYIIHQILN